MNQEKTLPKQKEQEITWEMLLEKYKDWPGEVQTVKILQAEGYTPEVAADMMEMC